jgi:hypothetical protein
MRTRLAGLLVLLSLATVVWAEDAIPPGLVDTFRLDADAPFVLTLQNNGAFDLTAPDGRKASGTYVVGATKLGLLKDNILRHFEYKIQNGNLLLKPTMTDGPEKGDPLGELPPAGQAAAFATYLSSANWQARRPVQLVPPANIAVAPAPRRDPVLSVLEQARADAQYYEYMTTGSKALAERSFTQARANFVLAGRVRPESAEAKDRQAAAEGLDLLQQAEATHQAGDRHRARELQLAAVRAYPPLAPQGQPHGWEPGVAPGTPTQVVPMDVAGADPRILQHLRAGQTPEASRLATEAWRNNPNNPKLRMQKEGVESLQTCETIYANVNALLARGQGVCDEALKTDAAANDARAVRAQFGERAQVGTQRLAAARARLVNDPFAGAGNTLVEARGTASEAADAFTKARDLYRKRADELQKESTVDFGVFTVRKDKEGARVKQLAAFGEQFNALATEAGTLAR